MLGRSDCSAWLGSHLQPHGPAPSKTPTRSWRETSKPSHRWPPGGACPNTTTRQLTAELAVLELQHTEARDAKQLPRNRVYQANVSGERTRDHRRADGHVQDGKTRIVCPRTLHGTLLTAELVVLEFQARERLQVAQLMRDRSCPRDDAHGGCM